MFASRGRTRRRNDVSCSLSGDSTRDDDNGVERGTSHGWHDSWHLRQVPQTHFLPRLKHAHAPPSILQYQQLRWYLLLG
ncbi:hypothetical protein SESBI_49507 [Sesbania bispinosa]|nr:hypothetical protein SESBI_49507 [Sesbania bispinosa]